MVRTAQYGMLNDVRYPGAVADRGTKTDAEHLVVILVGKHQHPGAALLMPQIDLCGSQIRCRTLLYPLIYIINFLSHLLYTPSILSVFL